MKRRQAIGRMVMIGGGAVAAYSGYRWYELAKTPEFAVLDAQKPVVAAMAEVILPATDTPGATDADAASYIIRILKEGTDTKTVNRFIDGLQEAVHLCDKRYGKTFDRCTPDEKKAVLAYFETQADWGHGLVGKARMKYLGRPFFMTLKHYTVEGYCRSEAGAMHALRYVPIPGKFIGCMPLAPGETSWATT